MLNNTINEKKFKMKCSHFNICSMKGDGCEQEEQRNCDLFSYISSKLEEFKDGIQKLLKEKGSFSYEGSAYKKLRNKFLSDSFLIGEREFKTVEDEIVALFLQRKR